MTVSPPSQPIDPAPAARRLTAKLWQLDHAHLWPSAEPQPLPRDVLAERFSRAVVNMVARSVTNAVTADDVIRHLEPTLARCDELDFADSASAMAYLVWHEVDRYHRAGQALDVLLRNGWLPIAKPTRHLNVLEVGSGPAPASYAIIDYYASLGEWSRLESVGFESSSRVEAHTLDRGPAWGQLVHHLSEELIADDPRLPRANLFGIKYDELVGFNPMNLHVAARDALAEEIADDEDELLMWPVEREAISREAARHAPPSSYDLIVVANFLTNPGMLSALSAELATLARSLAPGGVLLTLSGTSKGYRAMWSDFEKLGSVRTLNHVVDETVVAHDELSIRRRVASATVDALKHLSAVAGRDLDGVGVPRDLMRVMKADSDGLQMALEATNYPRFQIHAFKRQHRAMSTRERERIARRRESDPVD